VLLQVGDLRVQYGRQPRGPLGFPRRGPRLPAVDGVSLTVASGEMLALVGESGSGKSTTAAAVLRLLDDKDKIDHSGKILFEDLDVSRLAARQLRSCRRRMQIIYQDPYESLNPRLRVQHIVGEPLRIHGIGRSNGERDRLVAGALERVELTPAARFAGRYPHELSGGQRQRVAIAAALVLGPKLLVADEPVSMLDVSLRAGVMALLKRLCVEEGLGVLMITHDLAVVARFADRISVMYLGRIVETGDARAVLSDPKHPYTKALAAATPQLGRRRSGSALTVLDGEPANALAYPAGCRYRPRCPEARDECASVDPSLRPVGPNKAHEAACILLGPEPRDLGESMRRG
jgi:oligopeptide/dipeptide ABC transporter ATP-binding protein